MNQRVLICGYYGFNNIGDEAILAAMLTDLRRAVPAVEVTALSGDPSDTDRRHGVRAVHWIDIPAIIQAVRATDLMVLGGGGLFHDYWGVNGNAILTHTHTGIAYWSGFPLLAALGGKPCQIWAAGVGPLFTRDGRDLTRLSFELAARSSVRDDGSRAILEEIGGAAPGLGVTADPVWRLGPPDRGRGRRMLARTTVRTAGALLGVAIRPWSNELGEEWQRLLAAQLDAFLDASEDRYVLFVPFHRLPGDDSDDLAAARAVRARMRRADRADVIDAELSVGDAHGVLAACDVVVAVRLHAAMLAAMAGVPVIALAYDPKVRAAMAALQADEWTLPFDNASIGGALLPLIDRALRERHEYGASLARAAHVLAAAGAADVEAAAELLANPRAVPLPASAGRWVIGSLETQARRVAALPPGQNTAGGEVVTARTAALRDQLNAVRAENEALRREITHWKQSRLWRTADVYWRTRRALRLDATAPPILDVPASPAQESSPPASDATDTPTEMAGVQVSGEAAAVAAPQTVVPDDFPATPAGSYDVVVFSIIDWDFRFQRPQQLATQFARNGHRVFYLSTTRFLSREDAPWQLETKGERIAETQLRTPETLNIYAGRLEDAALAVVEESIRALAGDLAIADAVCIVQVPFWAPLAERLREERGWRVVYDCMDEWTNFPGFGADVLSLESGLVERADLTIVSAARLEEKWRGTARRLLLARNGVDLQHYRRYYGPNDLLGDIRHPILGYYGALASWVDLDLLERIARGLPDATIVLAGGHFDLDIARLEALPNVRLLGQRPYTEMPLLLWHFDVCLIPFLINDITEATNPVKFYEYLAAGKPVVAPPLTELLPYRELCYLAEGQDATLEGIRMAIAEDDTDPRREARQQVAAANDWSARYVAIDEAISNLFPMVSVVVVTHGGLELTRECIESLLASETWPRLEVIVADNASTDGTAHWLQTRAQRDSRLRVLANAENRGFPAANNQGIDAARGEIVVLLNNDTVVPPGLIGKLVAHVSNPRIGLVCPTTNFCGNEARVDPGYEDVRDLAGAAADRYERYAGRRFDLPVAAMYCVAARRETFERVGPLDEGFGIGMFEDDDYSERVRNAGLRVVCAEDAYVHHVGQGAFKHLPPERYRELWRANQEYYERKWGRPWQAHATREGIAPARSAFKGDGSPT